MSASSADATLVASLDKMTLNPPAASPKKPTRTWNPADFLALQSAKSSGLAGKYRTGKFSRDPANVLKDLHANSIAKDERVVTKSRGVIVEKILISDDSESEEDEQLISRGLWRGKVSKKSKKTESSHRSGKALIEYASYSATGQGYECGVGAWQDLHSPSQIHSDATASVGAKMTGILNTPQSASSDSPRSNGTDAKTEDEIPDALVDFILQYTREVITPAPAAAAPQQAQPAAAPPTAAVAAPAAQRTADWVAAAAAASAASEAAATGEAAAAAAVPSEEAAVPPSAEATLEAALHALPVEELCTVALNTLLLSHSKLANVVAQNRPAKAKLRDHIGQEKIEKSMMSLCECIEDLKDDFRRAGRENVESTDALFLPIKQGFTLLHHALEMGGPREMAQPYVVVEQQLLLPPSLLLTVGQPWDVKNNFGETPLWFAVSGKKPLFVDYLLELGADPNCKSTRNRQDSALHLAARKGMTAIVRSLTNDPRCAIDVTNNRGETPLFTAVLYNNQPERRRFKVDNIDVAEALLRAGANPNAVDRNGNTMYHVAACWLDTPMLEMFARVVPDSVSQLLANARNENGARPLDFLQQHEGQIDEERYRRCFFALLTCNAKCEERERRRAEEGTVDTVDGGTVAQGTVATGIVDQNTVQQGTSSPGVEERSTVERVCL